MALDAATLMWIDRLGPEPGPNEVGRLRALRRRTKTPSELRLLDSLLAPVAAADALRAQRAPIERRIAYLESTLQPEQVAITAAARRVAERRLVTALTDPGPQQIDAAAATQRAKAAALRLGPRFEDVESELRDLRARHASLA